MDGGNELESGEKWREGENQSKIWDERNRVIGKIEVEESKRDTDRHI